jgi:hypothetical protein
MSKTEVSIGKKEQPVAQKEARKSIRDLIFLGKVERVININGFAVKLKSLTVSDNKALITKILQLNDSSTKFVEAKVLSIAMHLQSIDDTPIENLCEDDSIKDVLDRKCSVVSSLQLSFLERLHQICSEIDAESDKEIEIEEIKEKK